MVGMVVPSETDFILTASPNEVRCWQNPTAHLSRFQSLWVVSMSNVSPEIAIETIGLWPQAIHGTARKLVVFVNGQDYSALRTLDFNRQEAVWSAQNCEFHGSESLRNMQVLLQVDGPHVIIFSGKHSRAVLF